MPTVEGFLRKCVDLSRHRPSPAFPADHTSPITGPLASLWASRGVSPPTTERVSSRPTLAVPAPGCVSRQRSARSPLYLQSAFPLPLRMSLQSLQYLSSRKRQCQSQTRVVCLELPARTDVYRPRSKLSSSHAMRLLSGSTMQVG